MSLTIENTRQISADIYGEGSEGERAHLASVTCSYRAGKRMSISLEITDQKKAAEQKKAVAEQVRAFIKEAFDLCAKADLPVPVITISD